MSQTHSSRVSGEMVGHSSIQQAIMEVPVQGDLPRTAADIPVEVYAHPAPGHSKRDGNGGNVGTPGPAPPPKMCAVCQRAIDYHAAMKTLACSHTCHADCADHWLRSELHCPLCKNQVLFPMATTAILRPDQPFGQSGEPRTVPLDGTDARFYGICRDCQAVFYRDPRAIKPETNAWYRCPQCRSFDVVNMIRASCLLQ